MSTDKIPLSILKKVDSLSDFYKIVNVFQINLRKLFSNKIINKPFELIWVSPQKIVHTFPQFSYTDQQKYKNLIYLNSKFLPLINTGIIKNGGWDKVGKKFEKLDVFEAFEKRFLEDASWQETDFYHRVKRNIEDEGKTKWS